LIGDTSGRLLIPTEDDTAVIKDDWLAAYGRVLLPAKWDYALWHGLSKQQKRYLYACMADLSFFFRRIILPFEAWREEAMTEEDLVAAYPNGLPSFMVEWCRDLQAATPLSILATERKPRTDDLWRKCAVRPTGTMKSTMTCVSYPMFLLAQDPSVCIVIGVVAAGKGEKFISGAKQHIGDNELFRWVVGDLHAEDSEGKWRMASIEVDRPRARAAPTLAVVGASGSIEGERFDVGIGDDLQGPENVKTQQSRDGLETWVDASLASRLHPHRRVLILIGTRHGANDLYERKRLSAEERGTWDYHELKMVRGGTWPPEKIDPAGPHHIDNYIVPDDLDLLWPEFWTAEKLVEDWVDDPNSFAKNRQNEIHDPSVKWFPMEVLDQCKADGKGIEVDGRVRQKPLLCRWSTVEGLPGPDSGVRALYEDAGFNIDLFRRVIAIDLAASDPDAAGRRDYTVFQLWALDPQSNARIVLDQLRRQSSDPLEIAGWIKTWVGAYRPHKLLIEAHAVAKLFARTVQEIIGEPVQIVELTRNKDSDIGAFKDLIRSGFAWIPWADDSRSTRYVFETFVREMYDWPDGMHDDTLITASHAYTELRTAGSEVGGEILTPKSLKQIIAERGEEVLDVAPDGFQQLVHALSRGTPGDPEQPGGAEAMAELMNKREIAKRSMPREDDSLVGWRGHPKYDNAADAR